MYFFFFKKNGHCLLEFLTSVAALCVLRFLLFRRLHPPCTRVLTRRTLDPQQKALTPSRSATLLETNRSVAVCLVSLTLVTSSLPQTSLSLASEQPPPSAALPAATPTQVFQPASKAPHSSGINVNAAPFQSMQTVSPLWI